MINNCCLPYNQRPLIADPINQTWGVRCIPHVPWSIQSSLIHRRGRRAWAHRRFPTSYVRLRIHWYDLCAFDHPTSRTWGWGGGKREAGILSFPVIVWAHHYTPGTSPTHRPLPSQTFKPRFSIISTQVLHNTPCLQNNVVPTFRNISALCLIVFKWLWVTKTLSTIQIRINNDAKLCVPQQLNSHILNHYYPTPALLCQPLHVCEILYEPVCQFVSDTWQFNSHTQLPLIKTRYIEQ